MPVRRGLVALCAGLAAIVVATGAARSTLDPRASYPEGPLYVGARLFYAEMGADRVSTIEKGRRRTFWTEEGCGPTALASYADGLLVFCHLGERFALVDMSGRTVRHFGREPGELFPQRPVGHPNDGIADDKGGVYFSDPGPFTKDIPAQGFVKRLGPDGIVTIVAANLWYPNGIWFDAAARKLYVDEHLARRVLRFDVGPDGALANKEVFAEIDAIAGPSKAPPFREAGVDGLERAPNGDLIVAVYGEGRLLQITPEGKLRREIPVPFQFVTNIAFAPDGSAAVVGSFINDTPPFPGQVIRLPASTFAISG